MILSLIIWIVWLLGAALLYAFEPGEVAFSILAASVILPVIMGVINLINSRFLSVSFKAPNNARKNERGVCAVEVQNRSVLPVPRVCCYVKTVNMLTGEKGELDVKVSVGSKGKKTASFTIESRHCGEIKIWVEKTVSYDCFGLFGKKLKFASKAVMTILPDTFAPEIKISTDAARPDDDEVYSTTKAGWDYSDVFQIREYADGDSLKQIHWKLTQKFDELIVKDPGLPLVRSVLILWDKTAAESVAPEDADAMAEVMVSVCQTLAENAVGFHVAWNDTETKLCELHEVPDFDRLCGLIPKMLSKGMGPCSVTGAEAFMSLTTAPHFPHVVYISAGMPEDMDMLAENANVKAFICGNGGESRGENVEAVYFTAKDYVQKLCDIVL